MDNLINEPTIKESFKNETDLVLEIPNDIKSNFINGILFLHEQIDFEMFIDVSINEMFLNFIKSDKFLTLPDHHRMQFLENYKSLMDFNNIVERFKSDHKLNEYR